MKKKINILLLTAFIVIISTIVLTSCTIFSVDQERKNQEVVASVTYKDQKDNITRKQFKELFDTTAPLYIQYYRMSAEEAAKLILDNMIKNNLQVMIARDYFMSNDSKIKKDTSAYDILSKDNKDYVIRLINDSLDKQLEKKVEDALLSLKNADKSNEENNNKETIIFTNEISPRDNGVYSDDLNEVVPRKIGVSDISKDWEKLYDNDKLIDDKIQKDAVNNPEIKKLYSDLKTRPEIIKIYKNAYNEIKITFKDKPYSEIVRRQAEQELINEYKKAINKEESSKDYRTEINKLYDDSIKKALDTYVTIDKDKVSDELSKLIDKGLNLINQPVLKVDNNIATAVGVKSILFQFSKDQKNALDVAKKLYKDDLDKYYQFRDKLANSDLDEDVLYGYGLKVKGGITVYKSNVKFDKKKPISINNLPYETSDIKEKNVNNTKQYVVTYKKYSFKQILEEINKDLNNAKDNVNKYYPDAKDQEKVDLIVKEKINIYDKWIYLVNDDPGMFKKQQQNSYPYSYGQNSQVSNPIYYVPTEGDTKFVPEYVNLARGIFNKHKANNTLDNAVNADDVNNASDVKNNIYSYSDISYIVNDFGVHTIMINNYGVNPSSSNVKYYDKDGNDVEKTEIDKILFTSLDLNAVTEGEGSTTLGEILLKNYIKTTTEKEINDTYKYAEKNSKTVKNQKIINEVVNKFSRKKK